MVRRLCKAASKSRFFKLFGAQTGLELVANQVWQNETNLFRHIDMSGWDEESVTERPGKVNFREIEGGSVWGTTSYEGVLGA
jgi:hypothetical protein